MTIRVFFAIIALLVLSAMAFAQDKEQLVVTVAAQITWDGRVYHRYEFNQYPPSEKNYLGEVILFQHPRDKSWWVSVQSPESLLFYGVTSLNADAQMTVFRKLPGEELDKGTLMSGGNEIETTVRKVFDTRRKNVVEIGEDEVRLIAKLFNLASKNKIELSSRAFGKKITSKIEAQFSVITSSASPRHSGGSYEYRGDFNFSINLLFPSGGNITAEVVIDGKATTFVSYLEDGHIRFKGFDGGNQAEIVLCLLGFQNLMTRDDYKAFAATEEGSHLLLFAARSLRDAMYPPAGQKLHD